MARLLQWLVRVLGEALVRLYYPRRSVVGAERLPRNGPAIFVLNHPNGLMDPLVLRVIAHAPIRFLAKNTLFKNPFGRLAMNAFGCLPIYRSQDQSQDNRARNEATFGLCRQALARGEMLALFPEGTSHSDPQLRPLKTGAARIALSAESEIRRTSSESQRAMVFPVGLAYDQKATFRSGLLAVVGEPIDPGIFLGSAGPNDRETVDRFTDEIRRALNQVVLQAESRDLLDGIARVASWTAASEAQSSDPAARFRRAQTMTAAYQRLNQRQPARVEEIARAVRRYGRTLRRLGVRDPWALELEPIRRGRVFLALVSLAVAAPFALIGALLGWIPYRLAGRVAARVTNEEDVLGTVKLLTGTLFVGLFWIAEIAVAAAWWGAPAAFAVTVFAPLGGFVALRFEELANMSMEGLRYLWLHTVARKHIRHLTDRRRALADEVALALEQSMSLPGPET
jgi:glycerol-3-phosphate O-acyltransferase / dihydroxyacetone phosphate acyltransferase